MSTLSQSPWHWSGQQRLKINLLPASSSSSSSHSWGGKIFSMNTPLFFQLISRKCKFGFGTCRSGKWLPRDVPMGRPLTCWPLTLDPCSPQKSLQSDELLSRSDKRRKTLQVLKGKKARAALWPVMMPVRVHLHGHPPRAPPPLTGVTPNNPKSWTSAGNSLKSTPVFSSKVFSLLNGQNVSGSRQRSWTQ